MGTLATSVIVDARGNPIRRAGARAGRGRVRGEYDAVQTNDNNSRHWGYTDALDADRANSYAVRKKLRERARYERANNCYADGLVGTLSNDVVGPGPQLQVLTGPEESPLNTEIEQRWTEWARARNLAAKLGTLTAARVTDGEGFLQAFGNPVGAGLMHLDVRPFECDRVHSPDVWTNDKNIDGVILDEYGNVVKYQVAQAHPGSDNYTGIFNVDTLGARYVMHTFRAIRPEQHRGISELMPALPLFALLRRYTLATVSAAETAADISAVLSTEAPGSIIEETLDTFDAFEIERGMVAVMPDNARLTQFKPEQPTSTYSDFVRAILREILRCVLMPLNIGSGDSSGYNFASGRLDHATYWKAIALRQHDLGLTVLDRIFYDHWLPEARLVYGWPAVEVRREWNWLGRQPMDPREANAEIAQLGAGIATLPQFYGRKGQDVAIQLRRGAEAMGVTLEEYQALIRWKVFGRAGVEAAGGATEQRIRELIEDAEEDK